MDKLDLLRNAKLENARIVKVEFRKSGNYLEPGDNGTPDMQQHGLNFDAEPTDRKNRFKNVPAHAVVSLEILPTEHSYIRAVVGLPTPWNGRFVGCGNGGYGGKLSESGATWWAAWDGTASVTCDIGTSRPTPETSGIGNPEVWRDFGYRATHLAAVAAKQLIRLYYGKDPDHSIFVGGSTGGQQALCEAQRYPEDYDGILAIVPAMSRISLSAGMLWTYQQTHNPDGSQFFTQEQLQTVADAGIEYMRDREDPPSAGSFVTDPRMAGPDAPQKIAAIALKKDPTMTVKHAEAIRKLLEGPVNPRTGERIYAGLPVGARPSFGGMHVILWYVGEDFDPMKFDFDRDMDRCAERMSPVLNAEDPDLRPFAARGGKLLVSAGSADSGCCYHSVLDYYERVAEVFGSIEKVQQFFRFFIIPGQAHGPEGPGIQNVPELDRIIIDWVEKDEIPDTLNGVRLKENGDIDYELKTWYYPWKTVYDPDKGFIRVLGQRGGVERIASRYRCDKGEK